MPTPRFGYRANVGVEDAILHLFHLDKKAAQSGSSSWTLPGDPDWQLPHRDQDIQSGRQLQSGWQHCCTTGQYIQTGVRAGEAGLMLLNIMDDVRYLRSRIDALIEISAF